MTDQIGDTALTIDRCTDSDRWDDLVDRADGPPFALSGWQAACERYGHDCLRLVAREAGRPVAGLPLTHVGSRLFGSKLVSPAFGEQASILTAPSASPAAVSDLLDRAVALADDRGVDFVSLRGRDLPDHSSFTHRNRFVTFAVSTAAGPDAVWADIKASRQRQITQAAEDDALEYTVGDSLSDLRAYYRLHLDSMRGHGTPPHSFAFFRTLWERLHDDGHLRLGLVWLDGRPINGMLDLAHGTTAHQWGVVSDYEHRERNGGSLALWKSLEWAAEAGYDTYDFGRTREGTGVYMFKKSFGGAKTWYDDYHYFPDGEETLPHPDDETYDPLKRVWRRLPITATRAIGPRIRKGISL